MIRLYTFVICSLALIGTISAQTPELIADLNPTGNGLDEFETGFQTIGNKTILVGDNGQTGKEIYVLENNTLSLVKDIATGVTGSQPQFLTVLDGKVYFVATDSAHGREIWVTDGTSDGTAIAYDLSPGTGSSNPAFLIASASGLLFFESNHKIYSMTPGSAPVKLNAPPYTDLEPDYKTLGNKIVRFKDGVAFAAQDASFQDSTQIWVSDGTPGGTLKVASYVASFSGGTFALMALEDKVLFAIENDFAPEDAVNGFYATTGVPGEVVQIVSAPGQDNNKMPERFMPADDNTAYFYTFSGMYITDGTLAGTVKLTNSLQQYLSQNEPYPFAYLQGKALFHPDNGSFTSDLYQSDGTVPGTSILKTIDESFVEQFVRYRNKIFFVSGITNSFKPKIWESDLTAAGTKSVYNYSVPSSSGPSIIILGFIDEYLYYQSNLEGKGRELYRIKVDVSAATHHPYGLASAYSLEYFPQSGTGSVAGGDSNEQLTVRLFDMQGRELQNIISTSDALFHLVPFEGLGVLTVQGRSGMQAFKVMGR